MGQLDGHIKYLVNPEMVREDVGWEQFGELVRHHRYYHVLEDIFEEMPDKIRSDLKEDYSWQLQKQLLIAKELQRIVDVLNQGKLEYINMKGSTLALELYGKLSDRITRDIDFLIREKDIDLFMDLFYSMGYRIVKAEKNKPEEAFRKIKKNHTLIHNEKGIIMELHWGLFSNRHFYTFQDSFFDEPDNADLNGTPVRIMNRENTFLYLCMHGIYHEYFRLFWLRDIAEMIRKWDVDWEGIRKRAKAERIEKIIFPSVILAGKVYDIQTPYDKFQSDTSVQWIVNHCLRVINRSSIPGFTDRLKRIVYFMKLRDELRYKVECVVGVGKRFWVRI